jgi:hypothetical protein
MIYWVILGFLFFVLFYVLANKDAIIKEHLSIEDAKDAILDRTNPATAADTTTDKPPTTEERVANIEAQMSTISAKLGIPNPKGPPPADLMELTKKYNILAAELADMKAKSEKGMADAQAAQDKLNAINTS